MTLPRQPVTAPPVRRTAGHLALPHLVATMVRDYARNPVNMLFLVLVPTVFVVVAADTLADAATLIGVGSQAPVETASAGWAASFLAGLAMYFQVAVNRDADRRLALAGFPAAGLTIARLITGVAVALAVTAVSTLALAASADMPSPARAVIGTLVSALIYLGIGAVVAVVLPDPLNGSMALLFIWIIDVFFGPVMGGSQAVGWRLLPTHFTSLWAVDLPSGHAATPGDLGWSLTWLALSLAAAFLAVASAVRGPRRHDRQPRRTPRHALTDVVTRTGGPAHQFTLALRLGFASSAALPCSGSCWPRYPPCSSCSPREPPRTAWRPSPSPTPDGRHRHCSTSLTSTAARWPPSPSPPSPCWRASSKRPKPAPVTSAWSSPATGGRGSPQRGPSPR